MKEIDAFHDDNTNKSASQKVKCYADADDYCTANSSQRETCFNKEALHCDQLLCAVILHKTMINAILLEAFLFSSSISSRKERIELLQSKMTIWTFKSNLHNHYYPVQKRLVINSWGWHRFVIATSISWMMGKNNEPHHWHLHWAASPHQGNEVLWRFTFYALRCFSWCVGRKKLCKPKKRDETFYTDTRQRSIQPQH